MYGPKDSSFLLIGMGCMACAMDSVKKILSEDIKRKMIEVERMKRPIYE